MQGQKGLICSQKALRVLDFLQIAGPAPFGAVVIATGLKPGDVKRALNILRGAGYSYPSYSCGNEFWFLDEHSSLGFNLQTQEILAWYVARLKQAGGVYTEGRAHYPGGAVLPVEIKGRQLKTGDLVAELQDLKQKPLIDCLRKVM